MDIGHESDNSETGEMHALFEDSDEPPWESDDPQYGFRSDAEEVHVTASQRQAIEAAMRMTERREASESCNEGDISYEEKASRLTRWALNDVRLCEPTLPLLTCAFSGCHTKQMRNLCIKPRWSWCGSYRTCASGGCVDHDPAQLGHYSRGPEPTASLTPTLT